MYQSFLKVLLIVFVILYSVFTYAQDTLNVLDPVVVSAALSPAQSSKTGRNIIVVKGDQITSLPVNSVDELLRYLPGIEVQTRGPMGVQGDISIRGANFQQVLVVLDGIRLNDPLTGHFTGYIPLPASEIERIEILKGAASAIYGTEAVGGVIHIITKTFARTHQGNGAQAQITGGEFGLWGVNAGANISNNKSALSAGILSNHAKGQPQRGTTGFFDLTTLSLSAQQKLGDHWNVALRSAYDIRDFSAQNFYTSFASDTASEQIKTFWQHAQVSYQKNKVRWVTDAGYKTLRDVFAFNNRATANDNRTQLLQILTRADIELSHKTTLTTGLQYFDRTIESNDRGNHSVWQSAAFVALTHELIPGFQVNPALRLDINENAGAEWVPQLNLSFKNHNYQLRGSVGRTIREADFTERFNNYNRTTVPSGRIGNPDLAAESAWNYEAGADMWVNKKLKISTTLFARNQQRLIDWVNTPYGQMPRQVNLVPTGNYALSTNIWRVNTIGWELDAQYVVSLSKTDQLTGQLGLIVLNNSGNEGTPSLYLSAQAKFLANFNLTYQVKQFSFSATGLYKQREAIAKIPAIEAELTPSYFLVNAKASYQVKKQLSTFIQIDNATNTIYSDLLGSAMPRRWLMGGVVLKFGD